MDGVGRRLPSIAAAASGCSSPPTTWTDASSGGSLTGCWTACSHYCADSLSRDWTAMRLGTGILYRCADPHSGPRRAKRAQETLATSRGLRRDIKGGARDWLTEPSL